MKKDKKKIINQKTDSSDSNVVLKGLKIVGVVLIVFGLFYVATRLFNEGFGNAEEKLEYQREVILAGQSFTIQKEGEYMVVYLDLKDTTLSSMATALSNYTTKHTEYKVYAVDLSEGLNKTFYAASEEKSSYSIDNLKVKSPSIIRVKDGKIIYSAEGKDKITEYINGLTK